MDITDTETNSVSDNKYDYLIFSGGGIKGVSYCGVVQSLERHMTSLKCIKGFAGTSVGSCVAGLLALGLNATELTKYLIEMDTSKIFDTKEGFFYDVMHIIKDYGVAPGNFIYNFLGDLIREKTGDADYTIEQLYLDKQIELVIVGTDMNTSESRYFYPKSLIEADRKIPIRKAIRISMSLPYIFEPIMHLNHFHVDGGVLDNYPIHVFDGAYPGDPKSKNGQTAPNPKVLGFKISTELDNGVDLNKKSERISTLIDYSLSFIRAFTTENDRRTLAESHKFRTVNIITPYFDVFHFSLTKIEKNNLIQIGEKATDEYFKTHK